MNIKSATATVMVDVDGAPAHEARSGFAGAAMIFRPVTAEVHVYKGGVHVKVHGFKVRKDGSDAVNPTDVRFWRDEVTPQYVQDAIAAAQAYVRAGF